MLPTTKQLRTIINNSFKKNGYYVIHSYTDKLKGDKRKVKFLICDKSPLVWLNDLVKEINDALTIQGYEGNVKYQYGGIYNRYYSVIGYGTLNTTI